MTIEQEIRSTILDILEEENALMEWFDSNAFDLTERERIKEVIDHNIVRIIHEHMLKTSA